MERYENSGLIKSFNKTDMTMVIKGDRTILWRSGDKPDKIRGISAGWAWLDECAYMDEEAYSVVLGRLRRRPGRLWMTTTPNGKGNWVYRLVQNRQVTVTYASTMTNVFNPSFYSESLLANYDERRAQQEVMGQFVDLESTLMQKSWFKEWAEEIPKRLVTWRSWDCAATESGGDATVGIKWGSIPGTDKLIIMNCKYGRYSADTVDVMIRETAKEDGKDCTVVLEQEPGSAGKRILAQQVKALADYRTHWYSMGSKKLARAVPLARAAAAGRVYYLPEVFDEKQWNEIESFTGTTADDHDDVVDALSLGFNHGEGNIRRIQVL
jgi:predicted phage terminase large subunit-like protein